MPPTQPHTIQLCYRVGCGNPIDTSASAADDDGDPPMGCGKHGGVTRPIWSIYNITEGWLTDNDTLIEWVPDVDDARWFASVQEAYDFLVESQLAGNIELVTNRFAKYEVIRLK